MVNRHLHANRTPASPQQRHKQRQIILQPDTKQFQSLLNPIINRFQRNTKKIRYFLITFSFKTVTQKPPGIVAVNAR